MFFSAASNLTSQYTGKERDAETGLDFFEARYYSGAQGRFTGPDPMLAKKEWLPDPQRWNRYAYVRNNPLKYVDPNGEDLVIYIFYGNNLSDEQMEYLKKNRKKIESAIVRKFADAGINNVECRDGSSLTPVQKSFIEKIGNREYGVGQLYFEGKSFISDPTAKGARNDPNQSGVFLDRVEAGLDLSKQEDVDTLNFRIGEVGAHELGHGQRFESDNRYWNWIRDKFGLGNLMGEGQDMPSHPKQFDPNQDKTRRAIDAINRIGDNTPKR